MVINCIKVFIETHYMDSPIPGLKVWWFYPRYHENLRAHPPCNAILPRNQGLNKAFLGDDGA